MGVTNYLLSGMILQVNKTNFYEESLGPVQAGTTTCRIAESPVVWKEIPQKVQKKGWKPLSYCTMIWRPPPGQESLEGLQRSSITWLVSGQTEKVGGMLHVTSLIVGMSPQLQRNLPKFAGDMVKWIMGVAGTKRPSVKFKEWSRQIFPKNWFSSTLPNWCFWRDNLLEGYSQLQKYI